jgi:aarF domain-containing kinase
MAALRNVRRHPFAYVSVTALGTAAAYANIVEWETQSREQRYHDADESSTNSSAASQMMTQPRHRAPIRRRFTLQGIDGVTHIERRPTVDMRFAGGAPSSPPPRLPRQYNAHQIEEYWSNRPVSVASRLLEIVAELSPLLWAYVRDFKLSAGDERTEEENRSLQREQASKLRHALTKLGPAFIKMGQQLSIRPDLVPPSVLAELQKLCDSVEPVPEEVSLDVLREELGCSTKEEMLDKFEGRLRRVAAASLGVVFRGTIKETGEVVAIKIQRPDMVKRLSLDLYLLQCYGKAMDAICDVLTEQIPYHSAFINAFARGSYMELDYEHEAANQLRFKREFEERQCSVFVPDVLEEFTTRRVICTQWVDGCKLVDAPKDQIRRLIPVGVEIFLTQLLDIGAFHSDPHPANLYATTDGRLCLLDFGLCAEIDERSRRAMTSAIVNLLSGDFHSLIANDAKELGFLPQDMDVTELKPILTKILTQGLLESGSNLHERKRNLMDITEELNEVFFRFPFSVPPFFALITRGLGLLEGIALSGDPDFDIFKASMPYATKRAVEIFGVSAILNVRKFQKRPTTES